MFTSRLEYVLAIAEEQSLTKAAKRLFVSQPALTAYLNRLEAELGAKLFDRSHTPIHLTEAGHYYIEQMKLLYTKEQIIHQNLQTIANPQYTLNISIGQTRGFFWLPKILPTFCSLYPCVNIHITQDTENKNADSLSKGETDIAIGIFPILREGLNTITLPNSDESLLIISHQKYNLLPKSMQDYNSLENPFLLEPQQLDNIPFIIPDIQNGLYNSVKQILELNHIHPGRIITSNNMMTGTHLASCGLGAEIVSHSILRCLPISSLESLNYFILPQMPTPNNCTVLYRRDSVKKEMIEALIQIMQNIVL